MGLTGAIGLTVADKLEEIFPADRRDSHASQSGGQPSSQKTTAGE